jgi:hypothetical protein
VQNFSVVFLEPPALQRKGVCLPDAGPILFLFSLSSGKVRKLAKGKGKCKVHHGPRGGSYVMVRKKGGGTRREYK